MGLKRAKAKKIDTIKLEELPINLESGFKITGIKEHERKRASVKVDLDKIVKLMDEQAKQI